MPNGTSLWRTSRGTGTVRSNRARRGTFVATRSSREFGDENVQTWRRSGGRTLEARLLGIAQVPPIATAANGTFRARFRPDERAIQYELTYADLSSDALFAHIHFGHSTDNGGILLFLCGGGDKDACPLHTGTVTGTITADDIESVPEQGVAAGDFATVVRIIRAGLAYVNVHSENFPDGEIRGQIGFRR